jgi:ribonuclease Z
MNVVIRIVVSLAAVSFLVVGLQFWIIPDQAAHSFGLEAIRTGGQTTLRADLGGLFIGLAVLCAFGAWAKRSAAAVAAATVLIAVIVGRLIGWIVDGREASITFLVIEVVAAAALLVYARQLRTPENDRLERSLKPLWIGAAIVGVMAVVAAAAIHMPSVAQAIFDRGAKSMSARTNTAPLADDALRVAICGSSAPLPSKSRAKACVAVFAGGKFWIVDAGPESVENLVLWSIPLSEIGGVLLTHYHSDHIGDLGELQLQTWAGGRPQPLTVYGGPGVQGVVDGFNQAYRLDQGYRTAHHGEKVMPSAAWGMVAKTIELDGPPTPAKDRKGIVFEDGSLKITALEVDHSPVEPAYAYRFDYKGRSVVVTGDLKYHRPLIDGVRDADILVSEAISRSMTKSLETAARSVERERTAAIMHDIQDYHISPEEAATIANEANVRLLVFYHLLPAPDSTLLRSLFSQGVNATRKGDWAIAADGSLYTLPFGSTDIISGQIDD